MLAMVHEAAAPFISVSGCPHADAMVLRQGYRRKRVQRSIIASKATVSGREGDDVALQYDAGSAERPRGHALLYFRQRGGENLLATYVLTLPIALDLARYMPPLLAAQLPAIGAMPGTLPIPPVPEPAESLAALERLAAARDDDLLFGGEVGTDSPDELMSAAGEAAQEYGAAYQRYHSGLPQAAAAQPPLVEEEAVYSAMNEAERLRELAHLVGTARYAIDGKDSRLRDETVRRMQILGSLLPAKYRVADLSEAAARPGENGTALTQLLIERCYKLYREEYEALAELEGRIRQLQSPGSLG